MEVTVDDVPAAHRYEARAEGKLAAFTQYRVDEPNVYSFSHTQTVPEFAGHGVATSMLDEVMRQLAERHAQILPFCPFVNAYLRKHPDYAELVPAADRRRFGLAS